MTNDAPQKRKRAPGGGRKPMGEFAGKSAVFSTRITPDLRSLLDEESQNSGSSISQIVERRLRDSFSLPKQMNAFDAGSVVGLRDWFAIHAPDMPSNYVGKGIPVLQATAKWNYEFADAMVAAKNGRL